MKANPTVLSLPSPLMLSEEMIPPSQVWHHLTEKQQHRLLATIVLVCQELVPTLLHLQESEVVNE